MRLARKSLTIICLAVFSVTLRAQGPESFRVLLGVTDTATTRWDGTLTVRGAGKYSTEGWRFEGTDYIDSDGGFHLTTHAPRLFLSAAALAGGVVVANGFIINADSATDGSEFAITTSQGDFSFRAGDVTYGNGIYKLGGRAYVDKVSTPTRLTDTKEEEGQERIRHTSTRATGSAASWKKPVTKSRTFPCAMSLGMPPRRTAEGER